MLRRSDGWQREQFSLQERNSTKCPHRKTRGQQCSQEALLLSTPLKTKQRLGVQVQTFNRVCVCVWADCRVNGFLFEITESLIICMSAKEYDQIRLFGLYLVSIWWIYIYYLLDALNNLESKLTTCCHRIQCFGDICNISLGCFWHLEL